MSFLIAELNSNCLFNDPKNGIVSRFGPPTSPCPGVRGLAWFITKDAEKENTSKYVTFSLFYKLIWDKIDDSIQFWTRNAPPWMKKNVPQSWTGNVPLCKRNSAKLWTTMFVRRSMRRNVTQSWSDLLRRNAAPSMRSNAKPSMTVSVKLSMNKSVPQKWKKNAQQLMSKNVQQ